MSCRIHIPTRKLTIAGMRWDVARNVALKAQWDGIRGEAASIFPYRKDNRAAVGRQHGCLLADLWISCSEADAFPSLTSSFLR
jgi:hypothetical protein